MASPAKNSKPELDRSGYISLMKKYGIIFEGPIQPEDWPEQYAHFFRIISQTSIIRKSEYCKAFNEDNLRVAKLRSGSTELVHAARSALRRNGNERTWRQETEEKVFKSFTQSALCSGCYKFRWKPYTEAMPVNADARERLEKEISRRRPCLCSELQLSEIKVKDTLQSEFSRELEKAIIHEDVLDLEKAGLKKQMPDTVIGLGQTPSFAEYAPLITRRHSPFEPANVLYPFMVLEAKSEKAPDSWGSIERQSAFALRTCLELQKNLRRDTGVEFQCLVWFFAFKGDEWRLYAAVPEQAQTRVIDLWHGTILSEDGALQLLLIIEYLQSWAYNVYRPGVLGCLVGGRLNSRRLTPGFSVLSERSPSELELLQHIPHQASDNRKLVVENFRPQGRISNGHVGTETSRGMEHDNLLGWTRWIGKSVNDPKWTRLMTIRHTDLVYLDIVSLNLPEELDTLKSCLESFEMQRALDSIAEELLMMFLDNELAIQTTNHIVSRTSAEEHESPVPVRAIIFSRSAIRRQDWQISRQTLVIACTWKSLMLLKDLSQHSVALPNFPRHCHTQQCACFTTAINAVSWISRGMSANLALGQTCLRLRFDQSSRQPAHFQWVQARSGAKDTRFKNFCLAILNTTSSVIKQRPFIEKVRSHWKVSPGEGTATATAMFMALDVPQLVDDSKVAAMIVKKPRTWPETTQKFCLFVMEDGVDFENRAELCRLIQTAKKDIFGGDPGDHNCVLADELALDEWIEALKDEVVEVVEA
ncbi:hypothetical protein LTR84_004758 [Exophiala bonariae]|uniref:Fungal-type protein kinase domain-containing protein n=1 Tax=Exophiala bonariae TaxID=1690606 RepID=A0AAV9NRV8_9EURO|nr:hypothetical protein LTR84_004758 [Exophiala bonariae]